MFEQTRNLSSITRKTPASNEGNSDTRLQVDVNRSNNHNMSGGSAWLVTVSKAAGTDTAARKDNHKMTKDPGMGLSLTDETQDSSTAALSLNCHGISDQNLQAPRPLFFRDGSFGISEDQNEDETQKEEKEEYAGEAFDKKSRTSSISLPHEEIAVAEQYQPQAAKQSPAMTENGSQSDCGSVFSSAGSKGKLNIGFRLPRHQESTPEFGPMESLALRMMKSPCSATAIEGKQRRYPHFSDSTLDNLPNNRLYQCRDMQEIKKERGPYQRKVPIWDEFSPMQSPICMQSPTDSQFWVDRAVNFRKLAEKSMASLAAKNDTEAPEQRQQGFNLIAELTSRPQLVLVLFAVCLFTVEIFRVIGTQ